MALFIDGDKAFYNGKTVVTVRGKNEITEKAALEIADHIKARLDKSCKGISPEGVTLQEVALVFPKNCNPTAMYKGTITGTMLLETGDV